MMPLTRPTIEEIQSLREKKHRYEKMLFWAEGERTVLSLLEGGLQASYLVIREDYPVPETLSHHPLLICRSKDENKIKDAQHKLIKKAIAAVLVFLIVTIVGVLMRLIGADDYKGCMTCINSPFSSECKVTNE